jgi:hypothetical protein
LGNLGANFWQKALNRTDIPWSRGQRETLQKIIKSIQLNSSKAVKRIPSEWWGYSNRPPIYFKIEGMNNAAIANKLLSSSSSKLSLENQARVNREYKLLTGTNAPSGLWKPLLLGGLLATARLSKSGGYTTVYTNNAYKKGVAPLTPQQVATKLRNTTVNKKVPGIINAIVKNWRPTNNQQKVALQALALNTNIANKNFNTLSTNSQQFIMKQFPPKLIQFFNSLQNNTPVVSANGTGMTNSQKNLIKTTLKIDDTKFNQLVNYWKSTQDETKLTFQAFLVLLVTQTFYFYSTAGLGAPIYFMQAALRLAGIYLSRITLQQAAVQVVGYALRSTTNMTGTKLHSIGVQ